VYIDEPVAALAFDLPPSVDGDPVTSGVLPPNDRDLRAQRAYVGYQSQIAEFYWVRTDDRFRFDQLGYIGGSGSDTGNRSRYERRAVTTRFGVMYR
jgi:hypothetical protein